MQNECIKVRPATIDDYKAIAKISKDDLGYDCSDMMVKEKLSLIDVQRECVFVADYQNNVIGYVHVEKNDLLYYDTLANILGLAVSSESRRMGAGKMLMAAAEAWGKEIGASAVRVNSGFSRLEAHDFYRTIGYNSEKQQIRFLKSL